MIESPKFGIVTKVINHINNLIEKSWIPYEVPEGAPRLWGNNEEVDEFRLPETSIFDLPEDEK